MPVESARARQAYADYLALGPERSLEKLLHRYQSAPGARPTLRIATLKTWSVAFGWQSRLQALADQAAQEAEARQAAHVRAIMAGGYAQAHERVRALDELAGVLLADLAEGKRWLHEYRAVGSGENVQILDNARFNAAEVEQLRGVLADLAKETGGRVTKTELTGKDGGPVEVRDADLTDEEIADRLLGVLARARPPAPDPPARG